MKARTRLALRSLSQDRLLRVAELAIILLAFALRIYRLSAIGLDGDEAFSVDVGSSSLSYILRLTATGEPHPPGYYSFLHAWHQVAGNSEFALRFPSVLVSVLTVVFMMKVARLYGWRLAGVVAATLFALNPYQVWYAQDIRMYAPVTLFALVAIYYAVLAMRSGRWLHMGLYAISMLLALYLHYYAIFICVFVNALFLAEAWRRHPPKAQILRWAGAQFMVLLLYVPWLAYASRITISYQAVARGSLDFAGILRESLVRYSLGLSVPMASGFRLSLVFAALAIAGLWFAGLLGRRRAAWHRVAFVAGYAFIPVLLGFLVSLYRPMFEARYFMVSSPAFYLLIGLGIAGLGHKFKPLAVIAGLLLVAPLIYSLHNYYYVQQYAKSDFRAAATYIREHAEPGDGIVLDGLTQQSQFWYYYRLRATQPVPYYVFPLDGPDKWQEAKKQLDTIMASHQGVWLLDYDVLRYDPQRVVETYLAQNYYQATFRSIGVNRVVYYASKPKTAAAVTSLHVACDGQVQLEDSRISSTEAKPGDIVDMDVRWRALQDVAKEYSVSWRLVDPDGRTVFQRDAEPASGFAKSNTWTAGEEVTDRYGMTLPASLTPGRYSLGIIVYDRNTGAVCQSGQSDPSLVWGMIPLTQVTVEDAPPLVTSGDSTPVYKADLAEGGMRLLGYDRGPGPFRAGESVTLKLYWQVTDAIRSDYQLQATMLDDKGKTVGEKLLSLGPAWFPTSRWRPGQVYSTYATVPVSARASTAAYRLSLAIVSGGQAGKRFTVSPRLPVVAREKTLVVPTIEHPKRVNFGGVIELLGYDMQPAQDSQLQEGRNITLTLYWRALAETETSYKVFVHLETDSGKINGQDDSIPQNGNAPTNDWVTGEVIKDEHRFVVQPGAIPGSSKLVVGLYDPATGQRIPLADGSGDNAVIASLHVVQAK